MKNIRVTYKQVKYFILILFIFMQIYLIFLNKHDALDIDSYPNTIPSPNIFQNNKVGQTFIAQRDNLARIDIMLGTHGRENDKNIIFRLWQLEPKRKLITKIIFNASEVKNNLYHSIRFKPVKQSKNEKYYFLLSSPRSNPNNCICAWMNKDDIYRFGKVRLPDKKARGDLVFRVYSQRPINTELGRIVRNYEGIFSSKLLLILAIIFFETVQIIFLLKLLDFIYKNLKTEE